MYIVLSLLSIPANKKGGSIEMEILTSSLSSSKGKWLYSEALTD